MPERWEGPDLLTARDFVSVGIPDTSASFPAHRGSNSEISCQFFKEEQMLEAKQSQPREVWFGEIKALAFDDNVIVYYE